ncbi:hypothetical protein AOLI_G00221600 [Acnodon oligacanthus]
MRNSLRRMWNHWVALFTQGARRCAPLRGVLMDRPSSRADWSCRLSVGAGAGRRGRCVYLQCGAGRAEQRRAGKFGSGRVRDPLRATLRPEQPGRPGTTERSLPFRGVLPPV